MNDELGGYQRASDQPIPFWKSPGFLIAIGLVALKAYERLNVALKLNLPAFNADPQSVGAWIENTGILIGAYIIANRRKAVTPQTPSHPIEPIATSVKRITENPDG